MSITVYYWPSSRKYPGIYNPDNEYLFEFNANIPRLTKKMKILDVVLYYTERDKDIEFKIQAVKDKLSTADIKILYIKRKNPHLFLREDELIGIPEELLKELRYIDKPRKDINQLAKFLVDMAIGDDPIEVTSNKNPAAVELGRLGGLKGGKARAKKLTKEQRIEIAKKAANARWNKK